MRKYWSGIVLLAALSGIAQAESPIQQTLTTQDYFIILLSGIVLVNVFLVVLYKLLHREVRPRQRAVIVTLLGSAVALLSIIIGSFLVIFDILVIVSIYPGSGIQSFSGAARVMAFAFQNNLVTGTIATGAFGFLLFLIGVYLLLVLHPLQGIDVRGMPTVSGAPGKSEVPGDLEGALNPVLNFRVISREDGKPAPDVKVILKEKEGIRFHSKFTDFDGFVKFEGVEGYSSDHVAYVEGDEERLIFRVIQI